MQESKDLTESEFIVWNSYNREEGRTEKRAIESYRNKGPKKRHHRTLRKQLMDRGLIKDLTPDRRGAQPHVYVAVRRRAQPPGLPRDKPRISKEDFELIEGGKLVFEEILTVVGHIRQGQSWRKPKRVYDISTNQVEPLLHKIRYLRAKGMKVTLPEEHSWDQNPIFVKGLLGKTDLRGNLGVRSANSNRDDGWIYPSLLEWYKYFQKVIDELQSIYVTYFQIVINRVSLPDEADTE